MHAAIMARLSSRMLLWGRSGSCLSESKGDNVPPERNFELKVEEQDSVLTGQHHFKASNGDSRNAKTDQHGSMRSQKTRGLQNTGA